MTRISDWDADIQRRELEVALWARADHHLWRVSAGYEPTRLASYVLMFISRAERRGEVLTAPSFRIDVFNFAQTSVTILALAALVFL